MFKTKFVHADPCATLRSEDAGVSGSQGGSAILATPQASSAPDGALGAWDRQPEGVATPGARWCSQAANWNARLSRATAWFYFLFAAIIGAAIIVPSNWHNPVLISLIVSLTVWSRSLSVKVTGSDSSKDAHAFSLNGVCILALAALNGPLPAVVGAVASEIGPFVSARLNYAGRRSTVGDLACNLVAAGAFALLAGIVLTNAADGFGHGVAFFVAVFAVSILADFISLLIVAAYSSLAYREAGPMHLGPYLDAWRTLFPALAFSTGVLIVALWVDRASGPAAFSFAVCALVGVQSLLGRISRVEYALRQERDKVVWLAHHDALTGAWNRLALDQQLMAATSSPSHERIALLFVDLDDFKRINDTLGHLAGDDLLRAVAGRLIGSLSEDDRVYRQGGDEFLVLTKLEPGCDAAQLAARAASAFEEPFEITGERLKVTGCVGVATWPDEAETAEDLLHIADSRMYERKARVGLRGTRAIVRSESPHRVSRASSAPTA